MRRFGRPRAGIEEGARGGPAPALLLRHLVIAEPFLLAVVVVRIARTAFGRGRIDERIQQFGAFDHVGDVQQAAAAARFVAARLEMLGLAEIRQHRFVRPAAIAELRPGVVVERIAAHVQHAVDRARSAERLAARDRDRAALDVVLRLGGEVPVVARAVQQLGEADRDVDPHGIVLRSGLQQQHLGARILGQPMRQHATGGTGADDDVVVVGHRRSPSAADATGCEPLASTRSRGRMRRGAGTLRFSIYSLVRHAVGGTAWPEQWRSPEPRAAYDVVIVGAGGHGLATAYYLAREHGVRNVAVLERGWLGGGNTGRNTTVIRSNYLWDESAALYEHALKLWEGLAQELNYNVMYSPRGVMMLAHSVHDVQVFKRHVHANRLNGIDNEWLTPEQAKAFCPPLNISSGSAVSDPWGRVAAPWRRGAP